MPSLSQRAARLLQPKTALEANLLIEVTRSVDDNIRPLGTLLFGVFFGTFATQWTPWPYAVLWASFIVLYPILGTPLRRRVFRAAYTTADAGKFLVRALILMMPMHVAWAVYVPMCWMPGIPPTTPSW
jgi:hypothetical protein